MRLIRLGIASAVLFGLAGNTGCSRRANAKANPDFPVPEYTTDAAAPKGRTLMPIPGAYGADQR